MIKKSVLSTWIGLVAAATALGLAAVFAAPAMQSDAPENGAIDTPSVGAEQKPHDKAKKTDALVKAALSTDQKAPEPAAKPASEVDEKAADTAEKTVEPAEQKPIETAKAVDTKDDKPVERAAAPAPDAVENPADAAEQAAAAITRKAGETAKSVLTADPEESVAKPAPDGEEKPAAIVTVAAVGEETPSESAKAVLADDPKSPEAGTEPMSPVDAAEKAAAAIARKPAETVESIATADEERSEPDAKSASDSSKTPSETTANAADEKPSETAAKPAPDAQEKPAETAQKTAALIDDADKPDAAAGQEPVGAVVDQALAPADPTLIILRKMLPEIARGANADDLAAMTAFYEERTGPLVWVTGTGFSDKAKAVIGEIRKADDWGLSGRDFAVPQLASGDISPEAATEAEVKLTLTVLKYARYARGGRVGDPSRISALLDQTPPIHPPKIVLTEIAAADAPDAYLRSLHPKHEQFQRLRKLLLKLRGTDEKEEVEEVDPALNVKLPPGRVIRAGMEDPQIALLRRRLKLSGDPSQENVYDVELEEAVQAFQRKNGLRPDGVIGNQTRSALNGAPKPRPPTGDQKIQRILINMERWRWLPVDLGTFYVWDNVPEFLTRVVKNGRIIHTDKIVAGQPTWPTPSFSADMKTIVFHPSWGVPPGIKTKELLPLLRNSSGGGFFGMFGGGYSSQAVLDAHDLRVYHNGRQIDPNQVNWNSVDIRSFNFQQPPGPKNVLGTVKFMFPNKHSVYMHDTPDRELFARSFRGLSHGCMRVEEPRRLAEVILGEDKGWSAARVQSMFSAGSQSVQLDTHVPVHVTYFTATVDDNGKLRTFGDFYGLDSRVGAALLGKPVRFETPQYDDEPIAGNSQRSQPRQKQYSGPPTLADAITDLFSP